MFQKLFGMDYYEKNIMTQDIVGKLFGDRGYISHKLFEELYERGLQLITKLKKNMKNKLVPLMDKILPCGASCN